MQINNGAVLKTSKEIEIYAPISAVWKIHADINAWKNWHPNISYAVLEGDLETGSYFEWKSDGYKLKSTIMEVDENNILGWKGSGFGASAIHIWEFTTLDNGNTLVRTKESMDGWLVKLFKGMVNKKLNDSLDAWLAALKSKAESR
ncbi:hypothetical protein AU255_17785 [Methyloprofundus sedimenti]|uniref:Polyketide cyclase/dehydrase n=1 Tax=Methyloprofundus sedimenti TaxID=1420851 RepID=A0A1V8M186_9GAMM|nr:SRPBCC family protein [Methyloprofundus sedimenti]OQK15324.1 hypothetical protein AU255_17785 [Methyloprofundus sedimenti]